jgi:hypothetical protein
MQIFSYILTDLTDHKSKPIQAALESLDDALRYGALLARNMLEATPDLTGKGYASPSSIAWATPSPSCRLTALTEFVR